MFVNLEKYDLISLIVATYPKTYEDMGVYEKLGFGRYYGGFNDRWEWNRSGLEKLSEDQLLDFYSMLRGKLYEYVKEE